MDSNAAYVERNAACVMDTYTRAPIALVRGQGSYVWDADGKQYLDLLTGLAVNSIGHCHPKVVEAVRSQVETLIHCSNLYHIDKQVELAERLTTLSGLDKAFFCNSGAEANEGAIKLARKYGKLTCGDKASGEAKQARYGIVTALQSFHGRTLATLTATGQTKYQEGYEPLPAGFSYVPFGDIASMDAAVGEDTCAVMLEPVQGESGVFPATSEYLRAVRDICDERGVLLIFDEVQAGLGRTGKIFAHEHYGIKPDMVTLAKALAGGVPIGCLLARNGVAAAFSRGSHASTFGGNPLACAAAGAFLDVITEPGFLERASELGSSMKAEISAWDVVVGDVRGMCMMIGFDISCIDAAKVQAEALKKGLLINSIGGRTIRLLPPLTLTREEASEGLSILKASISSAQSSTVG